jgi:hypothetical protein
MHRKSGVHCTEVAGQTVLYDEDTDRVHLLDPTTSAVYELLDGSRSIDEVASSVAQRLQLPADLELIEVALQELSEAELLEEESGRMQVPEISRRELIRRLGLTGALAALVPGILTVATPAPASAQSGGGEVGAPCACSADCTSGCCKKTDFTCVGVGGGACTGC